MVRHFLKDDDISPAEQAEIIRRAIELKRSPYSARPFDGPKTVALIFDKTSTRTRVSFAVGVADLGGAPLIIDSQTSQLAGKESVADTARVLGRQVAQIVWRTFAHSGLEEMAEYADVPVINSLSDSYHPCQVLADLMTIQEHKKKLGGLKLAFIGDASSNMANSYLVGGATAGMHVSLAAPKKYFPDQNVVVRAEIAAKQTGGSISVHQDPRIAIQDADVVVTDTWISMGREGEKEQRLIDFADYTIDAELFALAKTDAIFMHCLPAYRGYEVTAEVLDGPRSVIWDEAENRLHAQKALMAWLAEPAQQAKNS